MERKFKYNEQFTCPRCGKRNLDWGDMDFQGDTVCYDYICHDCGLEGKEYYYLTFDGHNAYDEEKQEWVCINDEIRPGENLNMDCYKEKEEI